MLAWTIYISFLGAVGVLCVPENRPQTARWLSLAIAGLGLAVGFAGAWNHSAEAGMQTVARADWISSLGIEYHLAADGISLTLVLLTGIAAVAGVLFSWNVTQRVRSYFAFYLALIGGVYGVFLSADVFLLFVFYELAIIPKYFLIAIWGSTRKEYGAMKLALYSFVGSALILIGLVAAYVEAGSQSTDLLTLAQYSYPVAFQQWAFPLTFVGFAVLAGLWPLHTWAPTGHVAAPTAASMLLAGVVMKLGAYGALRVAMVLFPEGAVEWQLALAVLAVVGIVYGATVALVQSDFKFVIGYSSVSHMGFVLLGLVTLNEMGLNGAVLQMFSHGVIAGLLFAVVGRMVYDRVHTRELPQLQAMQLNRMMPFAGGTFLVGSIAAMGMPGFSGFVAELSVLVGAWQAFPGLALAAGLGIVIGVGYSMRALQHAFYGNTPGHTAASSAGKDSITTPERVGALMLVAATLVIGLFPGLLLDLIGPSWQGPLFEGLLHSTAR